MSVKPEQKRLLPKKRQRPPNKRSAKRYCPQASIEAIIHHQSEASRDQRQFFGYAKPDFAKKLSDIESDAL